MNLDFVEALHLTQQLGVLLRHRPLEHVDVVVAPPFVDLRTVSSVIESERSLVTVAAQHVSEHRAGPFTGEVSVAMLQRLTVAAVIVGHSERRAHYAMDDDVVARTVRAVTASGLDAIVCVGEDGDVRDEGHHVTFVAEQLGRALGAGTESQRGRVCVAYEPVWAIGRGTSATAEQVREMSRAIREVLVSLNLGDARVLYGGSVNGENASTLLRDGEVQGFLVGGASLRAESFVAILRASDDCYARKR